MCMTKPAKKKTNSAGSSGGQSLPIQNPSPIPLHLRAYNTNIDSSSLTGSSNTHEINEKAATMDHTFISASIHNDRSESKKKDKHYGIFMGSLCIFLSILAASLTFPFLQAQRDKLRCDALCYGSMQSVRSGLTMIGTVLVGRLSDRVGRFVVLGVGLAASVFSYLVNIHASTLTAMWIALVPTALLNQNFNVFKALFADYSSELGFSETERASAIGKLGMAVGLSFMVGPVIGASTLSSYYSANLFALIVTLCAAVLLFMMPSAVVVCRPTLPCISTSNSTSSTTSTSNSTSLTLSPSTRSSTERKDRKMAVAERGEESEDESERDKDESEQCLIKKSELSFHTTAAVDIRAPNDLIHDRNEQKLGLLQRILSSITDFLNMPAVRSPGARLLMFMRCGMALVFSIFMTIWTVSLKSRFDFGPKGHAYFMGWVGLNYALSQGFVAKECMRRSGTDHSKMLLFCVALLSLGRVWAMCTDSLVTVYVIMAVVIMALGVMNTAIATDCTRLAGADQVGGLFGVLEAAESSAGILGPTLGGVLQRWHPTLPLVSIVVVYGVVFIAIALYYKEHVIDFSQQKHEQQEQQEEQHVQLKQQQEELFEQQQEQLKLTMHTPCKMERERKEEEDGDGEREQPVQSSIVSAVKERAARRTEKKSH